MSGFSTTVTTHTSFVTRMPLRRVSGGCSPQHNPTRGLFSGHWSFSFPCFCLKWGKRGLYALKQFAGSRQDVFLLDDMSRIFQMVVFVVTSHFLLSFTPPRGNSFIPYVQDRTEVSKWFNRIPKPHKREDVSRRLSRFSRKTRICRSANDRCVGYPE